MIVSNGEITIELRRATIRDSFRREAIVMRLMALCGKEREIGYRIFARVGTQATKIDGINLSLPTEQDDDSTLAAKWNTWIDVVTEDIENNLYDTFIDMLRGVDPATAPQPLAEGAPKNS